MIIRHVKIDRFRGIRTLDWNIISSFVCLLGRGDSTKSTILEAIDYALYPQFPLYINDSDFYEQDTSQKIVIEITIAQFPEQFLSIDKFGHYLRGWNQEHGVTDEPEDGVEPVLTIQLSIDQTFEPKWLVINDRSDGKIIGPKDRSLLGVSSIGSYSDRDLTWNRGSSLTRLTGSLEESSVTMAEVRRQIRSSLDQHILESWSSACENVEVKAKELGVKAKNSLKPGLDLRIGSGSSGALSLYDGNVPTRLYGLGSRRLLNISIQKAITLEGMILLVDEIELGLEPHRLRHLIRQLRPGETGQTIFTTHSSVAIEECSATDLHIVRLGDGEVTVTQVKEDLSGIHRGSSEAFLAEKLIVCEGKTEMGYCRGCDSHWFDDNGNSFASVGIVPVLGGGQEIVERALELTKLGYPILLLLDSDNDSVDITEAVNSGINVVQWSGNLSIEERILLDIPLGGIQEIVNFVSEDTELNEGHFLELLKSNFGRLFPNTTIINEWLGVGIDELVIRQKFGQIAKTQTWFKRIDKGESLASIVLKYLPQIPESDIAIKTDLIKTWCYGDRVAE